jgi:O-antigen ligase
MASKLKPMLSGAGSNAADAIASGRYPYRSELFSQAIGFIHNHPLLGLGEPLLGKAPVPSPALVTHTHNVAFQLSIQHGLPSAILFVGIIAWILTQAWTTRATLLQRPINRSLFCGAVATVWLHAYDIPSFDSRINMLGWLLMASCLAIAMETRSDETVQDWISGQA